MVIISDWQQNTLGKTECAVALKNAKVLIGAKREEKVEEESHL